MDWKSPDRRRFVEAVLSLNNENEARAFLRDLLTENEIDEFVKRFKAAEMLSQNVPYTTIEKETGFSSTTVARVSKWLNEGTGGYRKVIASLHHHAPRRVRRGVS